MRKFLLILAVALMSLTASAKGYNRAYFSYAPNISMFNSFNDYYYDEMPKTLHGFNVGYLHGFALSQKLPIFIEVGANIKFNQGTKLNNEDEDYYNRYKTRISTFSINVPINVTYKFDITSIQGLSVSPYAGLNFCMTLDAKGKEIEPDGDVYNMDVEHNVFQPGIQFGVGTSYRNFYFGLGGFFNFGKVFKVNKREFGTAQGLNLTVGYEF